MLYNVYCDETCHLEHDGLEKREGYYLLITAFYLDYDNALNKQLKHYEQYRCT